MSEDEPESSDRGSLHVVDISAIPDEPPDDILYNHQAGLLASAKQVWAHREIIYTLAERDFKAQYKEATPRDPLGHSHPGGDVAGSHGGVHAGEGFPHRGDPLPPLRLRRHPLLGILSASLGYGGGSLLTNRALLAKTQFPRECFPLEVMLFDALNTTLSLIPLTILFVIFGRAPAIATLWVPLFVLIEVVFAAGVTLAAASLIIQARDLVQVIPLGHLPRHLRHPGDLAVHAHPVALSVVGGFYVNLQAVYGFFNPLGPVIANVRLTMLPDTRRAGYR